VSSPSHVTPQAEKDAEDEMLQAMGSNEGVAGSQAGGGRRRWCMCRVGHYCICIRVIYTLCLITLLHCIWLRHTVCM